MMYGLIGEKLGHSFSPPIHRELGSWPYVLKELRPEEVGPFLRAGDFRGINVTIPYKQTVLPFLDHLSPQAEALGSVNTVVREKDGTLFGTNTDYFGFRAMLRRMGVDPRGKHCLVLGSGGASKPVVACLRDEGAARVTVISRSGENNYQNLKKNADAEILVNATPVGMYPHNGESPVTLSRLPRLEAVLDLIYNPLRTALLLEAEARGIPCRNGLYMLVAQAKAAAELFLSHPLPEGEIDRIEGKLRREAANWVLIGMPGCGKSTVGHLLAERTGRPLLETDQMIEAVAGCSCGEFIRTRGEEAFRALETEMVRQAGARSGCVIATGGGTVTRPENRDPLRQNGILFHLDRPPEQLEISDSRPLSETREKLAARYRERKPLYESWRDVGVSEPTPEKTAEVICEYANENSCA